MEQASFDTWESIFLFASVQGMFLSIMLFAIKAKQWKGNYFLATAVLLFSLMMSFYVSYWTGYSKYLPVGVGGVFEGFTFLISPLLLYYVKAFSEEVDVKKLGLHFLVYPVYLLLKFTSYWVFGAALQCLHLALYAFWLWKEARPQKQTGLLRFMPWVYALFAASYWIYYALVGTGNLAVEHDYAISMIISAIIYYIGYVGYLQQTPLVPKYHKNALSQQVSSEIAEKLYRYFDQEKPYLSGELRLGGLADKLGFSHQQISQVMNQEIGKSFSDFVNEYRIETAKEKLIQTQDKVEHIAYDSGFNNKVSFYQAFKKSTGVSPGQFRQKTEVNR